jgi:ABC-2 type transport system ATP-binding protein
MLVPVGHEGAAVQVRGLRKSYGERTAVDGVDLEVSAGEVVALLGPNGAGKTTTVEILEGYRRRDAGEVQVLGHDPAAPTPQWRARVGIVLQAVNDLSELTVRETVRHFASYYPRPRDPDEVVATVGLTDSADQRSRLLSGGQRRRLDVALGILGRPELLVLDEPTTGMDVAARQAFWQTMREDAATGRTIVFATHYLVEADEFAARTVLMKDGRIVADGPTADVRAAFGGRSVSFRPPAHVVHRDGVDPAWLARVGQALAPLGVTDVEVSSASLEAAFLALTSPAADLAGADR